LNARSQREAGGTFRYTPGPNFNGADSFTYTVRDGELTSAPAPVSITVLSVNDDPVAVADTYTTAEDTAFLVASVLANDTDDHGGSADGNNRTRAVALGVGASDASIAVLNRQCRVCYTERGSH